jgi:ribonuclease HI
MTCNTNSLLNKPLKEVTIYTDGACSGNPGPGGYGVVLLYQGHRKELSAGFRETTNNRMEILAVISGLESLKEKCKVTLYTDSQYVVNAIEKNWAKKWRANGWMRNKKEPALNADLWARLLKLCEVHELKFVWVRGHAGNRENERCDRLAVDAVKQSNLPLDIRTQPV